MKVKTFVTLTLILFWSAIFFLGFLRIQDDSCLSQAKCMRLYNSQLLCGTRLDDKDFVGLVIANFTDSKVGGFCGQSAKKSELTRFTKPLVYLALTWLAITVFFTTFSSKKK